ncbi:MAG: 30S ribosomal protein S20 [Candidatus Kaiserbacteria bacterium]|nr:30S ribosomal protein S20 [Candidatus Kaiserbacteria bacterium]
MPITASAKKEIRASGRKHIYNLRRLRAMRTLMKQLIIKHRSGDKEAVKEGYRLAQKAIDKAAKCGVIKERTASRKKAMLSRMTKMQTS